MDPKIILFRAPSNNNSKSADSYEEILRESKISAVSVPVLQFQFINISNLAEKLGQSNLYSGLVFTSPRSVEAVTLAIKDHQISLAPWKKLSTYVVGEATGKLVSNDLSLSSKGQESGNAAALAQYIINGTDDLLNREKPLLFPSADIRKETLPNSLRSAGISLDSITVYETKIRSDLKSTLQDVLNSGKSKLKGFVFFSPSGVEGVADALATLSIPITDFKLFAIGPSTEDAIRSRNLQVAGTASNPNAKCLLESLQNGGI